MAEESFRLKTLRVQGYKVLKDFALDHIGPLNVVVGPNGSGKSALWEVVTLFQELAGGPAGIFDIDSYLYHLFWPRRSQEAFPGVMHPQVGFVQIELGIERATSLYSYTLRLEHSATPNSPYCDTTAEILQREPEQNLLYYSGERDYGADKDWRGNTPKRYKAVLNDRETEILWPHFHPLLLVNAPNDALASETFFHELRDYLKSWRGFKAVFSYLLAKGGQNMDARLLTPLERFPGQWLDQPMGNLPHVLLSMKNQKPEVYEDIWEIFHAAVTSDRAWGLEVEEISQQIFVRLRGAEWPNSRYELADWPDGWKAFLSWLVALRTAPPGAVIYLEEPENNLHPRLLAQLLEQIELANDRGVQVFISTHSLELVNLIEPDELILMQGGQARRLDPEKADKVREAGILLGSAWAEGILEDIAQTPATP